MTKCLYIGNELIVNPEHIQHSALEFDKESYPSVKNVIDNLPESCISLGPYSCAGSDVTDINLPERIVNIGEGCFSNCKNLTSIQSVGSVTSLSDSCFSESQFSAPIVVPEGVTSIGADCFNFATAPSITLPNSVTKLGEGCLTGFGNTDNGITAFEGEIILPNSITELPDYCFNYCPMTSINIPDTVTRIGECCFSSCTYLESIKLPQSLISLGDNCFDECYITTIEFPPHLEYIGNYCFYYSCLQGEITFPASLKTIGYCAFDNGSYDITALRFLGDPPAIDNSFSGVYGGDSGEVVIYYKADNPNWTEEAKQAFIEGAGFPTDYMTYRFEAF